MNNPLVSILIPTYNRAHIIHETLDSVLAQTYCNWECIVVDDGSTDNTLEVLKDYCKKDSRFQYHKRPSNKPKGANACRNLGYNLSKGDYVIWFDSDDIMVNSKLEEQLKFIQINNLDFCVDNFKNFNQENFLKVDSAFENNKFNDVNLSNYLRSDVFWGTINFFGKKRIFEKSTFNEILKSGQEYNFFISVLSKNKNIKGKYLNRTLCYRRIHEKSIQQIQKRNPLLRLENKFKVFWYTLEQFKDDLSKSDKNFLLKKSTLFYHKALVFGEKIIPINEFVKNFKKYTNLFKSIIVCLFFVITYITRKGDVKGSKFINILFR